MTTMLVLGIDPGIALCGYGVVREGEDGSLRAVAYGAISTPSADTVLARLQYIYHSVSDLVVEHRPDSAAVEKLLFGKNVTNAMNVGQARGVVLLALAEHKLSVGEYTPASVKEAVAGYGNAPKAQMQEMVRLLLELDDIPRPDDAADALAVAITHLQFSRFQNLPTE